MSLYNAIPYRLLRIVGKKNGISSFFATVRHHPTFGTVTSACNAVAMGYRNAVPYQIPSNTERTVSAPRMRTASMAASSERK